MGIQMGLHQARAVLGVSSEATREEARSRYRRIMRQNHPDVTAEDSVVNNERCREASLAWESLEKHFRESQPESESDSNFAPHIEEAELLIRGFVCVVRTITVVVPSVFGDYAQRDISLEVPLAYCKEVLVTAGGLLRFMQDISSFEISSSYSLEVRVIDDQGGLLFTSSPYALENGFARYMRGLKAQALQQEIDARRERSELLARELDELSLYSLREMIRKTENRLMSYIHGYSTRNYIVEVHDLLRSIDREIDRLAASDHVELGVEALFSDRAQNQLHQANLGVIQAINAASVRTGGFIEPYGRRHLENHYREVLSRFESPLSHLGDSRLLVALDDYAPAEFLDDPSLDVAPLQVELPSNKGFSEYEVAYAFDEDQPIARIRVPYKVFERIAPDHGKKHAFPGLPHGIIWHVTVEFDGKLLAHGRLDEELTKRVDKRLKGLRRGKHADGSTSIGDGLYGI